MSDDDFDLVGAASELEGALRRFRELVERGVHGPLTSRKQLERTAKALSQLADADDEVGRRAKALVEAIVRSRGAQEALAARAQERARDLQERTAVFQGLLERLAALGQAAARLNDDQTPPGPERTASLGVELDGLVHQAAELVRQAEAGDFGDVQRQAESVRQSLLAARNRLSGHGDPARA